MPRTPTHRDWARTDALILQRGMPRARRTAYSRKEPAVAAYNVWLVTTAPTSRPSAAAKPSAMPAFVLIIQCQRVRQESSSAVNTDTLELARRRSATAAALAESWHRAST